MNFTLLNKALISFWNYVFLQCILINNSIMHIVDENNICAHKIGKKFGFIKLFIFPMLQSRFLYIEGIIFVQSTEMEEKFSVYLKSKPKKAVAIDKRTKTI